MRSVLGHQHHGARLVGCKHGGVRLNQYRGAGGHERGAPRRPPPRDTRDKRFVREEPVGLFPDRTPGGTIDSADTRH
jgi:hypothetical protein